MRHRILGATGIRVSEVGFGAWGIGGVRRGAVGYGDTDDRVSLAALRRAVDLGVTFFDTADLYGFGHSEELIGEALSPVRDRVVIGTKVGFLAPDGPQDFSPAYVRASLEGSLRRLRTSYVDVYQLHNPPVDLLERDPAIVETLDALASEGKICAWGISVKSPADGLAASRLGPGTLQVNFNMIDQRAAASGLLHQCAARRVGVIVRTPLCYGFLTAKYEAGRRFPPGDHRATWSQEQLDTWARSPVLFETIRRREEQTAAQFALRFCLSFDEVSTVIPGMLKAEHVHENIVASELGPLAEADREAIERTYDVHRFFLGRNVAAASATRHDPAN